MTVGGIFAFGLLITLVTWLIAATIRDQRRRREMARRAAMDPVWRWAEKNNQLDLRQAPGAFPKPPVVVRGAPVEPVRRLRR